MNQEHGTPLQKLFEDQLTCWMVNKTDWIDATTQAEIY